MTVVVGGNGPLPTEFLNTCGKLIHNPYRDAFPVPANLHNE